MHVFVHYFSFIVSIPSIIYGQSDAILRRLLMYYTYLS